MQKEKATGYLRIISFFVTKVLKAKIDKIVWISPLKNDKIYNE